MYRTLRFVCLTAAVVLLPALPRDEAVVALVLFAAAYLGAGHLGAAAPMLRPAPAAAPVPVVAITGDPASLALLRRVVPELRMRRPAMAIDAQIRWRQAAAARRRRHVAAV